MKRTRKDIWTRTDRGTGTDTGGAEEGSYQAVTAWRRDSALSDEANRPDESQWTS